MRVLQVLTLVSADGAYGGPVAVARAQCAELARRGHEVQLVAGWDGSADLEIPGVQVHLVRAARLPGTGFAGLSSPSLWGRVRSLGAGADVVHLHYARDLIQLPAADVVPRRVPIVLQTHGMIRPDDRLLARILDAAFVRRAYRRATDHLCLTDAEESAAHELSPGLQSVSRVRNGVGVPERAARWSAHPEVVFLARLHERKQPVAFVEMAARLLARGVTARFSIYGPDEGEAAAVRSAIKRLDVADAVAYHGPIAPQAVDAVLADAQAYVLPSVREVFPMALLEAMAAGLPSVITEDNGLADELRSRRTAMVTDGSPAEMAAALGPVLTDERIWSRWSQAARADIASNFSPAAVAAHLESIYLECTRRRPAGRAR